jgi:ferrochelatase
MAVKTAVILFNLGGPDKLKSVKPFLFNLFNDRAIISLPQPFRYLLAKLISNKREKTAQEIYQFIGGKSPILEETEAQKTALEKILNKANKAQYKCFIAMRYWHPFAEDTAKEVSKFQPDQIILLPLYPQFSTTTSESSIKNWQQASKAYNLTNNVKVICCYPNNENFIKAHAKLIKAQLKKVKNKNYRILFSAHGLPQKIIDKGDPYQWQVELTTKAIVEKLQLNNLDYVNCYQSKVGPLKWLEPSTETEIMRAAKEGKEIVIVPLAFVSEHSETLVELDIEYKELATEHNITGYHRVATLSLQKDFINALAELCLNPTNVKKICPESFCRCVNK